MLRWVFEKDVFDNSYLNQVIYAVKKLSYPYRIISRDKTRLYEDFEEVTSYPQQCPLIVHGSLSLANFIAKRTNYVPGAFCNLDSLQCTSYYPNFGKHLLNKEYSMLPIGDLARQKQYLMKAYPFGIFIRPNSAFKTFTGQTINYSDFEASVKNLEYSCRSSADLVVISSPKKIRDEYRFCVFRGEVLSGCQYMKDGQLFLQKETPLEVRKFASFVAKDDPYDGPLYILDIATTDFGIGVLEINSFSCSCWYDMDYTVLLEAATSEGMDEFNELYPEEE